ncbi:MAG: glucosamine-6-phosphate deaminase [Bacteroidota bacterium]|nr:glucosamine-6-phosphate deaminase [Bacteroidota bacterium]
MKKDNLNDPNPQLVDSYHLPFGDHPDEYIRRFERIRTHVFASADDGSKAVADRVEALITEKSRKGEMCVIGLPTGSTPKGFYAELVRRHKETGLSFKNVITFNLDEYYPIKPEHRQSYNRFMWDNLFKHIDILPGNVNIPRGDCPREEVSMMGQEYELKIKEAGGLDIQILGIGRTGHIGFNEPGSSPNSTTRLVALDSLTRQDAAADFYGEDNVPRYGITMGIGSIMAAPEIYLMAWGEAKADIIRKAVEESVSDAVPTSFLQNHPNATIVLDLAAAAGLTRIKTPWLVGPCEWTDRFIRKAVVWLCQKLNKPILKLTDRDYNDNGMSYLITEHGPSNKINIKVFNDLQHTITGWPGGKPNVDDTTRPERALPFPKKVVIFSPHPDDDVISMGGTFARLVEQGHDVHIAYQTSGSIAVSDDDAVRYLDFVRSFKSIFNVDFDADSFYQSAAEFYKKKDAKTVETNELRQIKAAIRRGEAKAACRFIGVPEGNIHFMNLPFYETGTVKKNPATENDILQTMEFLRKIKPHQIYAAGDLSDPHGTHRVCIDLILEALHRMIGDEWIKDCRIWLYRGAWQEWDLDKVDMAVPLSPEEVEIKRLAIFKHQSQKDGALFMGSDKREFWQRAEDRNKATAILYDKLGMAEYEAIEVFVRYKLA